jgi:hypothetical protein
MEVMMVGLTGTRAPMKLKATCRRRHSDPWLGSRRWGEPTAEVIACVTKLWQVSSDEEAIKLMNDSPYGLTASVWTKADSRPESEQAFLRIVDELETGTVFLNRFVPTITRGWHT